MTAVRKLDVMPQFVLLTDDEQFAPPAIQFLEHGMYIVLSASNNENQPLIAFGPCRQVNFYESNTLLYFVTGNTPCQLKSKAGIIRYDDVEYAQLTILQGTEINGQDILDFVEEFDIEKSDIE